MKRVPLQRRTPLRPKGTIKRQAKNRSRRRPPGFTDEVKAAVRRRSRNRCEIGGCLNRATQFHHRKLRRYGDHRAVNCLHCCLVHHDLIHAKPELSYLMGWLVQGHRDPAEVPVLH